MEKEVLKSSILNKKIPLIITACMLSIVLFAAVACGTYAWLIRDNDYTIETPFGNFRVWAVYHFCDDDVSCPCDDEETLWELVPQSGVAVSFVPSANNYFGNLRVNIIVEGLGEIYLRIMPLESWTRIVDDVEFVERGMITAFTFADDLWLDNRQDNPENLNDLFVYYFNSYYYNNGVLIGDPHMISNDYAEGATSSPRTVIPFIRNVPQLNLEEQADLNLRLRFRAEAVQRNRFREVWGIEDMPWPI